MMIKSALYYTNTFSWIFYNASSLKQQSADRHIGTLGYIILIPRHIGTLGYIILIPSQPVYDLSLQCCVLCGEVKHSNCIVIGLIRSGVGPTIYRTLTIAPPMRLNTPLKLQNLYSA